MGKVSRQGIGTSIFMYAGLVIGFLNTAILFPRLLDKSIFGFLQWAGELAVILALVAGLGGPSVIIRFFTSLLDAKIEKGAILSFFLSFRMIGVGIIGLLFLVAKPLVLYLYGNEVGVEYLQKYYAFTVLIILSLVLMELLESFASVELRPRVPTLFREVFARLFTSLILVLYAYELINEFTFVSLYCARYLATAFLSYLFLKQQGLWELSNGNGIYRSTHLKDIVDFAKYNLFSSLGSRIVTKIDILMIGPFLGMPAVATYAVYSFLINVTLIPSNGLAKIVTPILAAAINDRDFIEAERWLKRTALNTFAAGVFIYVLIITNIDTFLFFIGSKYADGILLPAILGIGLLFSLATGYVGYALNFSTYYRYDLYFKIGASVMNVVTNYIGIYYFGLLGAAIATSVTLIVINAATHQFVYRTLNIFVPQIKMVVVLALGGLCYAIIVFIPWPDLHPILLSALKGTALVVLFMPPVFYFNLVPDLTEAVVFNFNKHLRK